MNVSDVLKVLKIEKWAAFIMYELTLTGCSFNSLAFFLHGAYKVRHLLP